MMNIFNILTYFRRGKSAEVARNRLHIIIAQEKMQRNGPDYLPMLRQDILNLVAKYTHVDLHDVNVELHRKDNNSVLEVNVTLPDELAVAAN